MLARALASAQMAMAVATTGSRLPSFRRWQAVPRSRQYSVSGPTAGGRDVQNGAQAPREHMVLLDASNLIYRFHFGNSTRLKDKQQRDMTAIHHMLLYVLKAAMAEEVPVTRAVVVFDGPGEPSRRALFPAYKTGRQERPDTIVEAVALLPELLAMIGIHSITLPCTEADDIIATLATRAAASNLCVTIHSNDKDFNQLLTDDVRVHHKGAFYTAAAFQEEWGFPCSLFTEFQALSGDTADSIPGVKSIGLKKATGLIREYGTLENLYANLDDMKESAIKRNLKDAGLEYAKLMRQLVVLHKDIALPDHMDPQQDPWIGYLLPPGHEGGTKFVQFCRDHELRIVEEAFDSYCSHQLSIADLAAS